jgi:hypothetical protein
MAASRKKTIVRRLSQDWVAGYLPMNGFLHDNAIELLGLDGKILHIPAAELKWICYVRDFNSGEAANPERLLRKTFTGRPRTPGALLHLRLNDDDVIEGLAANDLTLITGGGIFLTPPDIRSNTQRVWIPTSAIAELELLAVVGPPRRKIKPSTAPETGQESLF